MTFERYLAIEHTIRRPLTQKLTVVAIGSTWIISGAVFSTELHKYRLFNDSGIDICTSMDSVVQIPGYAVMQEWQAIDHNGVCTYVQEEYCKYKQSKDLNCCEDHKTLWLYLRRLVRVIHCCSACEMIKDYKKL